MLLARAAKVKDLLNANANMGRTHESPAVPRVLAFTRANVQPTTRRAVGSSNTAAKSATSALVSAVMLAGAGADTIMPDFQATVQHAPTSFCLGFLAGLAASYLVYQVMRLFAELGTRCRRPPAVQMQRAPQRPSLGHFHEEPEHLANPEHVAQTECPPQTFPVQPVREHLQALLRRRPAIAVTANSAISEQQLFCFRSLSTQLDLDIAEVMQKSQATEAIERLQGIANPANTASGSSAP